MPPASLTPPQTPSPPLSPPQPLHFLSSLSLNLCMTEKSNALQLFQFGESIFYAFLNYFRHKVTTLQPTGEHLNRQHAQKEPTFYSGDSAPALARADVTCALGPAFSASAAFVVGEGPLALAAAVTSLWPNVGLPRGPHRRWRTHVDGSGGAEPAWRRG